MSGSPSSSPETSVSMVSAVSDLNTHTSVTISTTKDIIPSNSPTFDNFGGFNQEDNNKETNIEEEEEEEDNNMDRVRHISRHLKHSSNTSSVTIPRSSQTSSTSRSNSVPPPSTTTSATTATTVSPIRNNNQTSHINNQSHTQSSPTHTTSTGNLTPPTTPTHSIHSIHSKEVKVSPHNDEDDYRLIAKKLFNETFISIQPEEYTQFLAGTDDDSEKIRDYYMDLFHWNINILSSIRTLCAKLYLKGESQELDRILTSFTKSYLKQFPNNNFYTSNFEQIYIVIYSIILLNTSLHNNLDLKKISQTDFIKNTLTTFIQQDNSMKLSIKQRIVIEQELSKIYDDLLKNELHLKVAEDNNNADKTNSDAGSIWSTDTNNANNQHSTILSTAEKRISMVSKRLSSISGPSQTNSIFGANLSNLTVNTAKTVTPTVASAATNVTNNTVARGGFRSALMTDQAMKGLRTRASYDHLRTMHSGQQHGLYRKSSRSSIISRESNGSGYGIDGDDSISMISVETKLKQILNGTNPNEYGGFDPDDTQSITGLAIENFDIENYQDQYDLTLELQGSPYLKEGLLKLKVLNNDQQEEIPSPVIQPSNASITSMSSGRSFLSFFGGSRAKKQAPPPQPSTSSSNSLSLLPTGNRFAENFVVVSKGQLSLYSFDPKIVKKHQQILKKIKHRQQSRSFLGIEENSNEIESAVGDGNWLKNAANIGNFNLCSTIARMEKPTVTHSHSNPNGKTYVWSLNFPRFSNKKLPKKFLFEAGTKEIALEYVNTCNFWASKITAIPTLEESVSSIEYGWTNLDLLIQQRLQFKKMKHIMKYESVPRGVYLSNASNNNYGLMKQFIKTLKYYNHLKNLYQDFLKMKTRFLKCVPVKQFNCSNHSKIVHNYDLKIEDYKDELNKYKNYLILLGFGLQLRFDLEDEEKENERKEKESVEASTNIDNKEIERTKSKPEEEDDELTTMVKFEIKKLFFNMRDIANIIPTFENSKTIASLTLLDREQFLNSTLVKSPKNYTLSHFKDNESPIQQLLHSSNNGHHNKEELSTSYSTNTIKEEDEEEDIDVNDALFHMEKNDSETKVETPNFSNDSFQIIKEKPTRIRVHEVSNGVLLV